MQPTRQVALTSMAFYIAFDVSDLGASRLLGPEEHLHGRRNDAVRSLSPSALVAPRAVSSLAAHLEAIGNPICLIGPPRCRFINNQPRSALRYCYHAYPSTARRTTVSSVWNSSVVVSGSCTVNQTDAFGCTKQSYTRGKNTIRCHATYTSYSHTALRNIKTIHCNTTATGVGDATWD